MPSPSTPILLLENVTIDAIRPYDLALREVNLVLHPGDLATVILASAKSCAVIADLAQGLIGPQSGTVSFLARSWTQLSPTHRARQRALIGRTFDSHGWLSNLNVDENILLAQRHHRTQPMEALYAAAETLARQFGMHELPRGRPAAMGANELQSAQWIRALLGEKRLIILERPTRDVSPTIARALIQALDKVRASGAAVLWITNNPEELAELEITPTSRYRMQDATLHRESG